MKERRFYYGWIILATSFVTMVIAYGMRYSYSVFFVAINEEFGWSRAATAAAFSIIMLFYGLVSPISGYMIDRFGPRVLFPIASLFLMIGAFGGSQISSLWQLYLFIGIIMAFGMNAMGVVPNATLISTWFFRHRGTAMGLAVSGIGVGQILLVPFAQWLISHYGFRMAYIILGIISFAVVAPLTALFQRHKPEDMGFLIDGETNPLKKSGDIKREKKIDTVVNKEWVSKEWNIGMALKTYQFWSIMFSFFFLGLATYIVLIHQVAHAVDIGFSKMTAAAAFGIVGFLSSVGKILWGFISDRIGREITFTLGIISSFLGVLVFMSLQNPSQAWILYTYSALFGIGYAIIATLFPTMAADLFQGKGLGTIYGSITLGGGVGGSIGPIFSGYVYDTTGSYRIAFTLALFLLVISCFLVWVAAPRKVRMVTGRAKALARRVAVEAK